MESIRKQAISHILCGMEWKEQAISIANYKEESKKQLQSSMLQVAMEPKSGPFLDTIS